MKELHALSTRQPQFEISINFPDDFSKKVDKMIAFRRSSSIEKLLTDPELAIQKVFSLRFY